MSATGMMARLLCAPVFSGTAAAQTNIGELLDAGGKALTKDEVLATFRGATVTGKTAAGGETTSEFKDNGTVSGYVTNATGRRGSVFGTWTVDDRQVLPRRHDQVLREFAAQGLLSDLSPR